MIQIHELTAFVVSVIAFGYGAYHLFRKGIPKYFQLYVCAAGCYMLEELWSIVNILLGNGSADGILTVGMLGFFGCLCFMLSANMNEFDKVVDEGKNGTARVLALAAPFILLTLFAIYVFSPFNTKPAGLVIAGFFTLSPALISSYFNMKHLLLPEDEMGFLKATRWVDIFALVFYAANIVYLSFYLHFSHLVMSIFDLLLAVILFVMIVLCKRGADKWKTLI